MKSQYIESSEESGFELGTEPVLSDKMQISIQLLSGKTLTLDVEAGNTIQEVKELIKEQEGIPVAHQQLVLGDTQLVDDGMML